MKYQLKIKSYGKHKVSLGAIEGEEKLQKFIDGLRDLVEEHVDTPDRFACVAANVEFKLIKEKEEPDVEDA